MKTKSLLTAVCMIALPFYIYSQQYNDDGTIRTNENSVFSYPISQYSLPNGLNVVTVQYDSPGLAAFYIVMRVGSREEVEKGKTGFAHFFEHMMFRGTDKYSKEKYNEVLKSIGASANANTSNDRTVYHMTGNAGITRDGLLMRMSEENFDDVIRTNLKSVFNITKCVQRQMLKQRSGSIINITSVVGIKGNAGQANYAASKAGIIGFTKSVALELGSRNIRCNAVAPGFIETEMTDALDQKVVQGWRDAIPLKRGGTAEDVANLVLFLASDLSSYITGQVINVDGGMLT